MQNLLSPLTAALLAVHTVFGCCWHHGHDCTETCDAAPSVASADGHAHGSDADHAEHHGRHECKGGVCVFIGSAKAASASATSRLASVPPAPLFCDVSVLSRATGAIISLADDLQPPLRRHLLCQVMLI
jgi:hypothetical protein